MNRIWKAALPSFAYLATLALGSGCKITTCPEDSADGGTSASKENCFKLEPTVEYDGTARTASQPWSSGKSVTVHNRNGALVVSSGSTDQGQVQISGVPFTRDGSNDAEKQAATAHLAAMASPSIAVDGAGNITIEAPGAGVDGYKLTVNLPATGFDGVLLARNENGQLTFAGTLTSPGNGIRSDNGNVDATLSAASSVAVTATTDLGGVLFTGGWTSPMVSMDQLTGTATFGAGVGTLDVSSGNGDVVLHAP